MAVCESNQKYMILNHTRNIKGYLPTTALHSAQVRLAPLLLKALGKEVPRKGDLLTAVVLEEKKAAEYVKSSGNMNRKLQLAYLPEAYNS